MRVGILSDIHGDAVSLRKAIALFENLAVDSIICAGDVVEKGPDDDEVVALLRELGVLCVQGNHDENAVRHFELCQHTTTETPLKPKTIEYLKSLPMVAEHELAGTSVLVTHAIPSQNAGRVFHNEGVHRLSKSFKKDLSGTDCRIIIVGHTHDPFDIRFREQRIINPGATCRLKARDSHTAAVLKLPEGELFVYDLADASRRELKVRNVA